MFDRLTLSFPLATTLALAMIAPQALALHVDLLVASDGAPSPTLITGAHNFETIESYSDVRLFENYLEEQTFFGVNFHSGDEPGANGVTTVSGNLPTGFFALPGGDIFFDVAPISIDGVSGELLKWDGVSAFGLAPSAYAIELDGTGAVADGSAGNNTATTAWETVDPNGFFHKHRDFQLFDNDGNNSTRAMDGVYLISLTSRMSGLNDSLPTYMLFGAGLDEQNTADVALLDAAGEHVENTFGVNAFLFGDIDLSGDVDATDIDLLYANLGSNDPRYDIAENGGLSDQSDVDALVNGVLGSVYGDTNLDGTVTVGDINTVALTLANSGVGGWADGDFNGDGLVTVGDLNTATIALGNPPSSTSIPEPTTLALAAVATLFAFQQRR